MVLDILAVIILSVLLTGLIALAGSDPRYPDEKFSEMFKKGLILILFAIGIVTIVGISIWAMVRLGMKFL